MKILFILFFMLFSSPALAQENTTPPECSLLKDHVAKDNVTYQSGVDVNGNSVVPADLNAPVIDLPDSFVVPLTVDVATKLNNAAAMGVDGKGTLGFLEISKNGRVTYNGQDVTPQVYALCGHKPPVSDNGQQPVNIIDLPQTKTIDNPAETTTKPNLGEVIEGGEFKN